MCAFHISASGNCIRVGARMRGISCQYGLLGVDRVAVCWCPHGSGIIREPLEVGPERLLQGKVADLEGVPLAYDDPAALH